MRHALALARRGLGQTAPNPSVGCVVLDAQGRVAGRGWTRPGGRPHAETEALRQAGAAARGGIAYVTLEPCAHTGQTGPCADALIDAGVSAVVGALTDPDPRVSGKGYARLRAAGITVVEDVCSSDAAGLNAGFLSTLVKGRPHVTLKLASSLDGRIATAAGESRWITGASARAEAHRLRAETDAIMVGVATATTDDPDLTCRLPGLEARSPVRVVADSWLRLPLTSKLVRSAKATPLWLLARADADAARAAAFAEAGVLVLVTPVLPDKTLDLAAGLALLRKRGITRVLAEGGARLAASLLRARLADEIIWMHAGLLLGRDGREAVGPLGLGSLAAAPRLRRLECRTVEDDVLERWAVQD